MYIAKVNIETAAKKYKPGEKITGPLSNADIAFLKKHGFIAEEPEDGPDASEDSMDGDGMVDIPGIRSPGKDGGDTMGSMEYKDEAALKKMNKDEIVAYGEAIGLALAPEMLKSDMIDSVLNHMEERMAEAD